MDLLYKLNRTEYHLKNFLFLFAFFVSFNSFAQEAGVELCNSYKGVSSFNSKANNILDKILSTIGASRRFVLMPCNNIEGARAHIYKGVRYIFYNEKFMRQVTTYTNNWSNLAILAHEVGHHINGHTLVYSTLEENKKMELEADEFAGFVMAKLGASLTQATAFTKIFPEYDDTYETHPTRSKRLDAVKKGYSKSKINTYKYQNQGTTLKKTAEDFYYKAEIYFDKKKFGESIGYYSMAIELNSKFNDAYIGRGTAKTKLNDWKGALKDFNTAIDLSPTTYNYYILKAVSSNANRNNGNIGAWSYYECKDILTSYNLILKTDFDKAKEIKNNFKSCF